MRLSDKEVEQAVCPAGRKDALFFDDALPGFGVRVTCKGSRTFIFQYRSGAKVRRTTLGTFGTEITAAQARKKAESLRGQVRDARDPVAERRAAKREAERVEALDRSVKASDAYTVERLIEHWTDLHLAERSESYRKRAPADLKRALAPWLELPAKAFLRAEAVQALDATKTGSGPIAANRARAAARACWAWAVKRGALEANPWDVTPKPGREVARERVLLEAEIGDLWSCASELGEPWTGIFRMLLLTGQRRGEVAGMRWDELDLSAKTWTMPGSRTKNHRGHTVPLVAEAVKLIDAVKRRQAAELVFEGARKTTPSGFGKLKVRLDQAMTSKAAARKSTLQPWTTHDIRRSMATGLQRLGVRLEVTEALLNHVSGSRSGIVGVYQRHGWEKEKRAALEAWTVEVLGCAAGKKERGNVVAIREAG